MCKPRHSNGPRIEVIALAIALNRFSSLHFCTWLSMAEWINHTSWVNWLSVQTAESEKTNQFYDLVDWTDEVCSDFPMGLNVLPLLWLSELHYQYKSGGEFRQLGSSSLTWLCVWEHWKNGWVSPWRNSYNFSSIALFMMAGTSKKEGANGNE